jgi:hypothetical protein
VRHRRQEPRWVSDPRRPRPDAADSLIGPTTVRNTPARGSTELALRGGLTYLSSPARSPTSRATLAVWSTDLTSLTDCSVRGNPYGVAPGRRAGRTREPTLGAPCSARQRPERARCTQPRRARVGETRHRADPSMHLDPGLQCFMASPSVGQRRSRSRRSDRSPGCSPRTSRGPVCAPRSG